MLGVALQFGARREQSRPVRVGLEPVGIGGRRDVDGQARIVVDVPGSAQVVLAVDDHDVVIAQPVELDRRTDSPKPAPTMTTSNCWVPIIRRPYSTRRRLTAHSAGRAAGQIAIQLPSRTPWVVSNRS